jgi:uncharacterized membrane protein YcaP (DUF421 family)
MTPEFLYFLVLLSVRTLLVAVVLMIGFRLCGKRHIGQVNVYDLGMVMAVANAVQNAMTSGTGDFMTGIACAGTLLLIGVAMSHIFVRMPRIEQLYVGEPVVLVKDGEFVEGSLKREELSEDDIMMALRSHGLGRIKDAHLIVLEADGSMSVVPKEKPKS